MQFVLPMDHGHSHERLTPREIEVLKEIAKGHTNQEIADVLYKSRNTVSTQVESILGKLGASNRAEATYIGVSLGYIPPFKRKKPGDSY